MSRGQSGPLVPPVYQMNHITAPNVPIYQCLWVVNRELKRILPLNRG